MRHAAITAVALFLSAAQVQAQSADAGSEGGVTGDSGGSLMERGLELFMDGLKEDLSPAMKSLQEMAAEYGPALQSFLEEMGPALSELFAKIDNWKGYYPPEILPNGDIILRKRTDGDKGGEDAGKDGDKPTGSTDI